MIASRHLTAITIILVGFCVAACFFIVYAANSFETSHIPEYQNRLFGDAVISLQIEVDPAEWQGLLDNAQAKEWISADLIINGERFSTVGIRTKGNSSLSQVASSNSDRYSLQFEFNHYVKGQTYYGLDSFCINNIMGDATYMKDYLSYEIMNYISVATPLTNFADVSVNGEGFGFYLALERYDKAFLDRVYQTSAGQLYSVKIAMGRRGDFEDAWQDVINAMPNRQAGERPQGDNRGGGGMGGFGGGGNGGGSLIYTDDNISSYSAIFDNAVFGSSSDKDK